MGWLSSNPGGIPLLESNQDEIDWAKLSSNPNGIALLESNQDKIDWANLSANPNGINLLKSNKNKIIWGQLASNPNIFEPDQVRIAQLILDKSTQFDLIIN